ncbi:MAG: DUF4389 domain-containing protein [Flavobacteriales bacterium]
MFKFNIKHQESYSRGELLLRSFFGILYIVIPHGICLMFLGLWGGILRLLTFFIILFTGKFPENFFKYQVRLQRWVLRMQARMLNLSDGYPAFGLDATDDKTELEIPYTEEYSRGLVLLVGLLGQLILIPHIICVWVLLIGLHFVILIAWFAVLFTGKYPDGMHRYAVNTMRWLYRIMIYLNFMNAKYPPFSGKSDEDLAGNSGVIDSK